MIRKNLNVEEGMILVAYRKPENKEQGGKSEVMELTQFYELVKHELKVHNGMIMESICQFISEVYIPTMGVDEVVILDIERDLVARVVKNRVNGVLMRFKHNINDKHYAMTMVYGWTMEKIVNDFVADLMDFRLLPDPECIQIVSKHVLPLDREIREMAVDGIIKKAAQEIMEEGKHIKAVDGLIRLFKDLNILGGEMK